MKQSDVLRLNWKRLTGMLGLEPAAAHLVYTELTRRYAEPARHYHNFDHLVQVLTVIDQLEQRAGHRGALGLAAWFHDAVYDPRAKDNEARSAELAENLLGVIGIDAAVIQRVKDLVMCTQTHQVGSDPDAAILLDADLAILGAAPPEYSRYAAAIRQEYAWVPDETYREERKKILESFLKRDRIFLTEEMFGTLESQARTNLQGELATA